MSPIQTLTSVLRTDEESLHRPYRRTDCGHEYRSAKRPVRARCLECLSADVESRDR